MRVDLKVTENAFAHSLSAPVGTAAGGGADRPHTIFPPVSLSLAMVGGKPVRAPEAAPQFPNSARSLSLTWWGGIRKSVPVLRPHTIFPPCLALLARFGGKPVRAPVRLASPQRYRVGSRNARYTALPGGSATRPPPRGGAPNSNNRQPLHPRATRKAWVHCLA